MTDVHGYWDGASPHRPMINATFVHPCTKAEVCLDFMIDTGADRTFIVPEHQSLLEIPPSELQFETPFVQTLAGMLRFRALQGCTLIFNKGQKEAHAVNDITVFFAHYLPGWWSNITRRFSNKPRPLVGEGQSYSVIGRDVLQKLSLGFCKEKNLLFLSKRTDAYYAALENIFPKPVFKPAWMGTKFKIADYKILRH